MVMPVPQPQIFTSYMAGVKRARQQCVALKEDAGQRVKDSESLRKKFLANSDIKEGMAVLLNLAKEDVEDWMKEMLKFAFDDSATKTVDGLKQAFLDACRAPVSCSSLHARGQPHDPVNTL